MNFRFLSIGFVVVYGAQFPYCKIYNTTTNLDFEKDIGILQKKNCCIILLFVYYLVFLRVEIFIKRAKCSNTYHVLALITSTFHEKIFISPIIYFFHEKVKILLVVANKKKFFCLLEFEYHSMEKLHCTIKLLFFLFIYTYEQLIFMCELLHILIWRKICN